MFGEVVPAETPAAVAELQRRATLEPANDSERSQQLRALHILEGYKLLHGDTSTIVPSLARLRALPGLPTDNPMRPAQAAAHLEVRIATLEALFEHVRMRGRKTAARPALLRLDSLARAVVAREQIGVVNRLLVRMFRENGDDERALAASRRRLRYSPWNLATSLREEAHFAAAIGDRAGAIKACELYLALRPNPDPVLRAQVDSVRAECNRVKRGFRIRRS
jgi:hypothetical protein